MAVFITIEDDPFSLALDAAAAGDLDPSGGENGAGYQPTGLQDYRHVRRPFRGIQIKEETYASIQVFTADLKRVGMYDSGGVNEQQASWAVQPVVANFLIQSVQRTQEEKFHLVETFGEDYGFFFGQRPIMMRFSGMLLNSADFNWKSEWWANYDEILRGTKLVERGARIYLTYDTQVFEGYLLQSSTVDNSQRPYESQFNFTMWVVRHLDTSSVGDINYPESSWDGTTSYDFGGAIESPLLKLRNLNTGVARVKSIVDAVRWGAANMVGPLGAVQQLTEAVKQFAFGGTQVVPLSATGTYTQISSQPGNYFAPGSIPPQGIVEITDFGRINITVRGPDTAPGGSFDTHLGNRYTREPFFHNWDEYVEYADPYGKGDPSRNTVSAGMDALDILDATLKTAAAYAKFGLNYFAAGQQFAIQQTQSLVAAAVDGTQNMLATEEEIAEGLTGTDLPDTTVVDAPLEEELPQQYNETGSTVSEGQTTSLADQLPKQYTGEIPEGK